MRLAIFCVLLGLACSAPVPRVDHQGKHLNTDGGLVILVPTEPVNSESDRQPRKRQVEYELITIPAEVLRREIRQIAGLYSAPNSAPAPAQQFLSPSAGPIIDSGIIITPGPVGGSAALPTALYSAPAPAPAPKPAKPAKPAKPGLNFGGDAVLSTAGNILETTGNNLNSIGAATATNAGNAFQFISEVGQGTGAAAAEVAGSGLAYAGQLSGALLRALLQVPAIKARLIGKLIEETGPLTSAINDVVADSADDLARTFEMKTSILSDAMGLIIRLIQDTLALKGRIIAQIGSSGLDFGPKAIDGALKIGGAVVESASGVARVLGDGVGDIIQIGKDANFPDKPALPNFNLPSLPSLVLPNVELPQILPTPAFEAPEPAPLPVPVPDPIHGQALLPVPAPAPAPVPVSSPDPGYNNGFSASDSGFSASDSGFSASDSGFPASDSGFSASDSGFSVSDNSFSVSNNGYPLSSPIVTQVEPEQFYQIIN